MKLIIMNKAKATPAMFLTKEEAEHAIMNMKCATGRVRECRITSTFALTEYVTRVFGDSYYTAYDPVSGDWFIHEDKPYDTATCDWCSLGGRFCEYCTKYGEDPYENCGTVIDWELYLKWLDGRED